MSMTKQLSEQAYLKIDREIAKYPKEQKQSAVIAALAIAQTETGWINPDLIEEIAAYLQMPPIAVEEVVTFYNMFRTKPVGRCKLTICTNLPCALSGAEQAAKHLQEKLGLQFGQTTADGEFTLLEGECMGACGDAPVLLVNNHRMCSLMTPDHLDQLIKELEHS